MNSEIRVGYLIQGSFSPEHISSALNIIPSKTWETGDLISPKAKICYKESGWLIEESFKLEEKESNADNADNADQLDENADAHETLESLVIKLFAKLKPSWEKLKQLSNQYEPELSCVIYFSGQIPEVHFSKNIVTLIADLNLSVDIDLYCLRD
ncbi:MAG: DUF4279 domain-containing protein [Pseudanabaena sp.]|jgi:hypothetical protein